MLDREPRVSARIHSRLQLCTTVIEAEGSHESRTRARARPSGSRRRSCRLRHEVMDDTRLKIFFNQYARTRHYLLRYGMYANERPQCDSARGREPREAARSRF